MAGTIDHRELELHLYICSYVGAGNWTWVLGTGAASALNHWTFSPALPVALNRWSLFLACRTSPGLCCKFGFILTIPHSECGVPLHCLSFIIVLWNIGVSLHDPLSSWHWCEFPWPLSSWHWCESPWPRSSWILNIACSSQNNLDKVKFCQKKKKKKKQLKMKPDSLRPLAAVGPRAWMTKPEKTFA